MDAGNPLDPSTTQALIVRWSGAGHTVGAATGAFARLYSTPVSVLAGHEIDMRLAVLSALPGRALVRELSLGRLPSHHSPRLVAFEAALPKPYVVLNIGARTVEKRLSAETYAQIAEQMGDATVLTYGPQEESLAREVSRRVPRAQLAPPTSLADLVHVMSSAAAVVSCDTGPMHVAVAARVPTCGIFVSTDPARYGYSAPPHSVIDAREDPPGAWLPRLVQWLAGLTRTGSRGKA
ncbi:MAG: glycosyltransferase family 9 protein [Deltaproteobacteria bacterium]|nr:glycosyltransferase family 9 protein [Deltaproteobacteria bacterium]